MAGKPVLVNGYLKMTRLGPPKLVKQKNNRRAPEKFGMWAFPWPYYDEFFVYHRYLDLLPKEFRGQVPTDPKWLETDEGEPVDSLEGHELDEYGYYHDLRAIDEWHAKRDEWIKTVARRIEKRRSFWYSGPIYTHIRANGEIVWDVFGTGEIDEWDETDTQSLHRRIIRTAGNVSQNPKERGMRYTKDHLEVFIPRGGRIRSSPR